MEIFYIFLGILIGFFVAFMILKTRFLESEKRIRENAIRGSRNAITGEIYEKILPSLPSFPYLPRDMVFVGKGVDYIIFDGLSEGELREVIFLELKSGKARLNVNEKSIKRVIDAKKVRFAEMRIGTKATE